MNDNKTYVELTLTKFSVAENSFYATFKDSAGEMLCMRFHKDALNREMLSKVLYADPHAIDGRTDLAIKVTGIMDAQLGNTAASMFAGFMDEGVEYPVYRTLSF